MGKSRKKGSAAKQADRHALYQDAVQTPQFEVDLATRVFRKRVGRKALSLREDFCGTALLCSKWVASHKARTATGVDIDAEVLDWGRVRNVDPLRKAADRVTLLEQDVRQGGGAPHDVVMALNYSYFCFKTRPELSEYFVAARSHLAPDGLFFLDLFGGWEAQQELKESRKVGSFRYVWEQATFNPITADLLAHIHFRFRDGSRLNKAFTYDWRLWTMPELRELLAEAGFGYVEVLWEGEDHHGHGNGVYRRARKVHSDPCYNAYLVASVDRPPRAKR
ncbi:MAG: class I SAM-dependent methyltransferase [Myxococcota bacterium]